MLGIGGPLLWPGAVSAQSLSDNIAGLSKETNQPIDIQSDTLEVLDDEKRAIFRGNVRGRARRHDAAFAGAARAL